jgi:aryl-alcohol dehydrogenase
MVFGHEGAGIVEAVGDDVTVVKPGDHVIMSYRSCRSCAECTAGHPTYCQEFGTLNAIGSRPDGSTPLHRNGDAVHGNFFGQSSFASHAIAYQDNLVVVDADVDLSLVAPLGCGVQTGAGAVINVLRPEADSSFVVFGAGAVGLSAVMAAKSLGVSTILAVDPVAARRDIALEVGATAVIDPSAVDALEAVNEATGGGAGYALDTTAIPQVISQAVDALATRGVLAVVGVGQPEVTINITEVINRGKTIRGVIEGDAVPQDFLPQLLDMHKRGELPIDKLIRTYPFEDIATAVADAASGAAIKPVLVF